MRGLFLLLIVIPICELLLLLEVGSRIGVLPTLALVVTTAFIGINVLRMQGFATFNRAQRRLQAGELPGQELVDGFMLAVGGALLLAPGFITDTIGFILLLPWTRRPLARRLLRNASFTTWNAARHGSTGFGSFQYGRWQQGSEEGDILEGEVNQEPDPAQQLKQPPRD